MGKIKSNKFRFHQKSGNASKEPMQMDIGSEISKTANLPSSGLKGFALPDNIFAGVNINLNDIAKSLPQDDIRSISGKSHRELKKDEQSLPKKEKMKRRHERFIQKLEVMYASKKNASKKKKKNKTAPGIDLSEGDEAPLLVNLSDSDPEEDEVREPKKQKKQILSRPCMKAKHRQKADKQDRKHFLKVLNDPVFKTNPAATITQFLKARIAEKRPDLLLE